MKMTAKQRAVFNQIARGEVGLVYNGDLQGSRVVDALNAGGCKVNLQVDWLLAKGLVVLGPMASWQPVVLTERGDKVIALV